MKINDFGQDLVEIYDFGVPETRKIAKWAMLGRSQKPHTRNICVKLSIGNVFLCRKKLIFFTKNIFSQYFHIFSAPQDSEFQDLADPGCVRPYLMRPTITM